MLAAIVAISVGAALGALLRWGLSLALNPLFGGVALGTLAANCVGGYLVGLAVAMFAQSPQLPPEWRLFTITGFLGGLTTFSTFSAEVVGALHAGRTGWAAATVALHLGGSLLLTVAGMATPRLLLGR